MLSYLYCFFWTSHWNLSALEVLKEKENLQTTQRFELLCYLKLYLRDIYKTEGGINQNFPLKKEAGS